MIKLKDILEMVNRGGKRHHAYVGAPQTKQYGVVWKGKQKDFKAWWATLPRYARRSGAFTYNDIGDEREVSYKGKEPFKQFITKND